MNLRMKTMLKKINSGVMFFYFILIGGIFPLFYTSFYYNIQKSKSYFFIFSTILVSLLLLVLTCIENYKKKEIYFQVSFEMFPFFAFAGWAVVSSIISPYGMDSITGESGRYIGSLLIVFMCVCLVIFANNQTNMNKCGYIFTASAVVVGTIGIMHFVGIDVGGFAAHVPERFIGHYLSTIGNINIFSNYISIAIGLTLGLYCLYFNKVLLVVSYVFYLSLFAGNSDGGFLGTFIAFAMVPVLFSISKKVIIAILAQVSVFFLACFTGWIISEYSIRTYMGVPKLLAKSFMIYIAIVFIVIAILAKRYMKENDHKYAIMGKVYTLLLITGSALVVILFIMVNVRWISIPKLLIRDRWGSNRGFIWRKVLELYSDAPAMRKIFGYGPDTFKLLTTETCYKEMMKVTGKIYDSAHNDFLHYLITTGIVGAVLWAAGWVTALIKVFKKGIKESYPYLCALMVYLVQTLVVPVQPITTPLAYMIAGLCLGMSRKKRK